MASSEQAMQPLTADRAAQPRVAFGSLWRAATSGLCFIGFALLAGFAMLTLLPIGQLLPGNRSRRARRLASLGFRILLAAIQAVGLGRVRIEGRRWMKQAPGCLLVANHPCFVDIVVMFAALPEASCIMKEALRRHPLFGPFARACAYLSNSSGPLETVAACRAAKEHGESIIIFPEGSRTRPGEPLRFRRGAAQIALRADMTILPVTIHCTPPVLTHGRPWFHMPPRRVEYVISFHQPRPPAAFAELDGLALSLAARRLTRGLEVWFTHRLKAAKSMTLESPAAAPIASTEDAPLAAGRPPQ